MIPLRRDRRFKLLPSVLKPQNRKSTSTRKTTCGNQNLRQYIARFWNAGWSSPVARQAHDSAAAGSQVQIAPQRSQTPKQKIHFHPENLLRESEFAAIYRPLLERGVEQPGS